MSIVVTKSSPVVVCPSEPAMPMGNVPLSWFDKAGGPMSVSWLLVFDTPIDHPVEIIKRALSGALVHYYPVSGRLAAGADGSGEVITCTGEGQGVVFVGASASCAIDVVLSSPAATALLNDLFVHYPEESHCLNADPLLLMQVTEFACGGTGVGVTWNHLLADAAGMGQFLQAVGELARGMSVPSIVPVRSDHKVMAVHLRGMTTEVFFSAEQVKDMPFLDLTIPSSLITRINAQVSFALGKPCTVFEAVVALLWQCRARAVICEEDPDENHATLVFASNVRSLVGSAEGYYGNCCIVESVQATCGQVANGDLKDVVGLIKMCNQKMRDHIVKEGDGAVEPVQQQQQQLGYNALIVSSWRNIGLEAPDFGGGRPARVLWYMSQGLMPTLLLCPPCKGKDDGVNVLGYIVKKDHVNAFMQEVATVTVSLSSA